MGGGQVGGGGYLVKMLKAMPKPPKTMKASFRPSLGMYCNTMGYRSSLVSARNSVSQNWGPKVCRSVARHQHMYLDLPVNPVIV